MNDETLKRMEEEFLKRREALRERFRYSSQAELEALKARGSLEGHVASSILKERQRELSRSARIIAWATVATAIATVAAALAAWTAIFQYGRTAPNESRAPAASITAMPSPSR
jgi:hypothetical protein